MHACVKYDFLTPSEKSKRRRHSETNKWIVCSYQLTSQIWENYYCETASKAIDISLISIEIYSKAFQ